MKNKVNLGFRLRPGLKTRAVIYTVVSVAIVGILGFILFTYLNVGVTTTSVAAPPTNISGVINSYLRVTSISLGTRTFTANNLSGIISDFQVGKTVMIYQAQGANITTSNSSSYGTITAFNNSGNYEFAVISSISGTGTYTITVSSLVNSYTAGDAVQLVSVPDYVDANVSGTVTAVPWSSSQGRGGIVAFQVSNELTLSANVDVSGQGFAGGQAGGSNGDCPDNTTYRSNNNDFGAKGESISTDGRSYARGAQATAGGGGNPHNAGGGGGSNYTYGGDGGQGWQPGGGCANLNAGGLGGKKINYTSLTKAFFGGGGGAGQQNNGSASSGAAGGGIIIVRAKAVKSSCDGTYGFISDGQSAANSTANDGAGGGGAGGVILLDVMTYNLTCPIFVRANGGNGGSVNDAGAHGGGGGGGIGVIMETFPTTNSNVTILSTPGTNGKDCNTGACNTPSGTLPETPSSYKIGISNIPGTVITLPVKLISFTGEAVDDGVELRWATSSEENNDYFTVERSSDGINFTPFAEVDGAGNSNEVLQYSAIDNEFYPVSTYYRLKQTDYDGRFSYSKLILVSTASLKRETMIYPNPASGVVNITRFEDDPLTIRFVNEHGVEVLSKTMTESSMQIDVSNLNEGIYLVEMSGATRRDVQRLVIKR